jgi:hypothetical protein
VSDVKKNKGFYTDRRGLGIADDTNNIESDCNVITFICGGDWPCYLKSCNGDVVRYLDQYQEISFGSDRPEILERGKFEIVFDPAGVGTKLVYIERSIYRDETNC